MEGPELYDVTIIGGGPAGMYAAFHGGARDMKTKVIEAKKELGGRLLLYPEKTIMDVGGMMPVSCGKLLEGLKQQARTFDPLIVYGQQVTGLERREDGTFMLTAAGGERHGSRTIVLAIGYGVLRAEQPKTGSPAAGREDSGRPEAESGVYRQGFASDYGPLKAWGLHMEDDAAAVDGKLRTNIPGIFAAGDFANHESKLRLIAGAFADAALAIDSAKLYINPAASRTACVSSAAERFE